MNKYDWSNVPKEVKWIATDAIYTSGWGYTEKPEILINSGRWFAKGLNNRLCGSVACGYVGNWQDSLEERPND